MNRVKCKVRLPRIPFTWGLDLPSVNYFKCEIPLISEVLSVIMPIIPFSTMTICSLYKKKKKF